MLLGAEVVKIELPGRGDLARRLGPGPRAQPAPGSAPRSWPRTPARSRSSSTSRTPAAAAPSRSWSRDADVLLENFRAGVLARLGFAWERLRELNPGLVYCAISGFGQTGPMSQAPAYDQIIQGLSGMMSVTGTPETAPLRVGFPVVRHRRRAERRPGHHRGPGRPPARTGEGCFLDVSMLEASLSAMGWAVSNYLVSGVEPEPMGDQNATAAPSGTFDAADGPLNIAANRQEQFETLCRLVGRADLVDDPRFADREARKTHRAELNAELNAALRPAPGARVGADAVGGRGAGGADPDRAAGGGAADQLAAPRLLHRRRPFPGDPDDGRCGSAATASSSTARRCRPPARPPRARRAQRAKPPSWRRAVARRGHPASGRESRLPPTDKD